jgi:hypothetical protein
MRTGDTSGVLSAKVGHDYIKKFTEIFDRYNELDDFHYVPKIKVMQQMIDNEHKRLFDK